MAVKLTDVAKKAGVSPTTVSRVINNYGSLSQKTIDKVKQAMKEFVSPCTSRKKHPIDRRDFPNSRQSVFWRISRTVGK